MKRQLSKSPWNLGLFLFLCVLSCTSKQDVKTRAVLTIGDRSLTVGEFAHALEQRLRGFDTLYARHGENVRRLKEDILREFIQQTLVISVARRSNITVSPQALNQEVDRTRAAYPDDLTFREALAKESLSLEEWTERQRYSALERLVFDETAKFAADPSDQEMRVYFEKNKAKYAKAARVRLRQVVVSKEDDARRILQELKKGASIEKIAGEFSIAPEGKSGGDTGWVEKGVLEIFDAAFKMNVGTLSDVVKSPYGYHIFKVTDKAPALQLKFEEVRASIRRLLRSDLEQALISELLEKELRSTKVLRNDGLIASVQVEAKEK